MAERIKMTPEQHADVLRGDQIMTDIIPHIEALEKMGIDMSHVRAAIQRTREKGNILRTHFHPDQPPVY